MKQDIKTFVVASLLMASTTITFAQDQKQDRGNRPSPEQMTEQQAQIIAKQLGLDEKTSKKFLSVYKSEQNDMRELMPRRGGMKPKGERPQGMRPQGDRQQGNPPADFKRGNGQRGNQPMSEETQKKVKELKEKYNKEYAKFLSQEQIEQVYKLQEQGRGSRRQADKK